MKKLTHAAIRSELAFVIERLLVAEDLPIKFRAHQREAYECMLPWLRSREPGHRRYIAHATGMGKTLHFLALVIEGLKKGLCSLIVVPNKTLVVQTAREIHLYTKGTVAVGHISSLPVEIRDHANSKILYATKGWQDKSIVIITQASFLSWAKRLTEGFDPHIIIRDEMHWAYTDAQLAALECFSEALIVGYSATPDYLTTTARSHFVPVELDNGATLFADPKRLADTHFGSCLHRVGLREGIECGVLAPLAWGQIDLSSISLEDIPVVDGPMGYDYDPVSLAKHMERNQGLVLEVIERLYATNEYGIRDLQVAAACPSVVFAEEFARIVGKYTRATSITGATHHTDRQRILAAFEADEDEEADEALRAISSVFVLREGWDSSAATMLLFLRATMSRVLYEQFLGRILRKRRDGKPKMAIVLDPLYQQAKFAPLSAPMLYGVPGEKVTRGGVLIGPRGPRGGKRLVSPYLPKGVRVTIKITPIEIEYWAGPDGFFEADGARWGTINSIAGVIKIAPQTVSDRINESLRSRSGRDSQGKPAVFYVFADVKALCADLLDPERLQVGPNGFVEADGLLWGSTYTIAKELKISTYKVQQLIGSCRSRNGKEERGSYFLIYALQDVKDLCSDHLDPTRLQVGPNGFVEADGLLWGSVNTIAKHLKLPWLRVQPRTVGCRSREGKTHSKMLVILYALPDLEGACSDLLAIKLKRKKSASK